MGVDGGRLRYAIKLQWGRGLSAAEMTQDAVETLNHLSASMGPRSFSRGNEIGPAVELDEGTCFNGAAAFQPRKSRIRVRIAVQRASSFNGAAAFQPRKSGRHRAEQNWPEAASMGPRPFSRGNADGSVRRDAALATRASMGPRPFSRGNGGATAGNARVTTVWLQWGRGLSAAEMLRAVAHGRYTRSGFNGAAAFQPRK